MANISAQLEAILVAVYGEEVRGSIHDALAAMNVESNAAMEYAATAKDSAINSAAAAKESENNAAASESAAKTSETNAGNSESAAAKSASDAQNAAGAAKTSEDNAAASENASKTSETNAVASERAAKTSETNAANSAKTATEKATSSSASAEAAKASEEKAANSESAAKTSETAAINAQKAAESAKTDAEAAANEAAESKTVAETAKLAAQNAKTAAETAKADAKAARDDAAESKESAAESALSAQQYSGKPPKPQNGTWWIWDADQKKYLDSGISCELTGPTGNGIQEIKLTKGDHLPGTTDIYTVTMTDGTTYSISVYNGRNGTGAGDVLGIWFDLVIPVSSWANGKATISDSRLLALSNHKYLVGADQACRYEYLDCNVQPRDITQSGFITFTSDTDPAEDITVNVIRLELAGNGNLNEVSG